jgi:hypothetical protein
MRTSRAGMAGWLAVVVGCTGVAAAQGANIYVLSSGDLETDNAVVQVLALHGHTATVGVQYSQFDGTQNLSGFDTVYVQANWNWTAWDMPLAGQQALVNWVQGGGRLVSSEWVLYLTASGGFQTLSLLLPAVPTWSYGTNSSAVYVEVTHDPVISAGLPTSFGFPLVSYAGTETFTSARAGATVYYNVQGTGDLGLAGWSQGNGMVFSFTSTCGPAQLQNGDFGRLFSNVMGVTALPCYANCDGSTTAPILNVEDFTCFINEFAAAQSLPHGQQLTHYANCDHSTTAPVLNVEDFTCFINAFAAGCR